MNYSMSLYQSHENSLNLWLEKRGKNNQNKSYIYLDCRLGAKLFFTSVLRTFVCIVQVGINFG